jgi:SAM-dependent methyltransferase
MRATVPVTTMGGMGPETISDWLAAAAACRAAERSGLLAALTGAPGSPEPGGLGLDPRLTAALLEALGAVRVLERDPRGSWRVDPATVRSVARAGRLWDELEPALRSGRAAIRSDAADAAAAGAAGLVTDLEAMWGAAPVLLADRLTGRGRSVLDLGAGTAVWSRALLDADPARRGVAVDLAPVLEVTARVVAGAGLAERMQLVAADVLADPLPDGCDLVVLANVCHLFGTDVLAALFAKVEAAVAPGGTVVVVDLLGDARSREPSIALYALGLALRTEAGRLHGFATYARLLHQAGLEGIARLELDHRLSAVVAQNGSAT